MAFLQDTTVCLILQGQKALRVNAYHKRRGFYFGITKEKAEQ